MGLDVSAKGLTAETSYSCGYMTFGAYRMNVAKAYGGRFGELYGKLYLGLLSTDEEAELCAIIIPEGLALFLNHSDCDGKFSPKECRSIYDALLPLKVDMQGHNYGAIKPYNMHERWLNMFKHCAKRRVTMYFH